jgi:hypothetical protein
VWELQQDKVTYVWVWELYPVPYPVVALTLRHR